MQNKYAADGLVVISVHLLNAGEDKGKAEAAARKFIADKKLPFTNLLLDEPYDLWSGKWDAAGAPVIFLFNRAGRIEKKYIDAEQAEEIDKLLPDLLQKK